MDNIFLMALAFAICLVIIAIIYEAILLTLKFTLYAIKNIHHWFSGYFHNLFKFDQSSVIED